MARIFKELQNKKSNQIIKFEFEDENDDWFVNVNHYTKKGILKSTSFIVWPDVKQKLKRLELEGWVEV